ncbi:MAG TPA: carboxypeptidase-like regulatory domain-containing protein [Pyrinomonadaceae bacterium]|nr:carboxypeptidase-like regulatory domain-containing protein [Pyrinomonadaceae bacterium]
MARSNTTRLRKTFTTAALLLVAASALLAGQLTQTATATVRLDEHEDDYGRETFRIAGRVTDERGRAVAGVRVTLAGARFARAHTDADGEYTFTNLEAGATYRVTLSKADYVFAPPSVVFRRLDSDEFPEHEATGTSASIGGRVTDTYGRPLRDATVTLNGSRASTARTDGEGFYRFDDLPAGGHYRVTVSKSGLRFVEPTRVFDDLEGHRTADFEGVRTSVVWGRVTLGGRGLRDVTVRLAGRGVKEVLQTDAAGYFNFGGVPAGATYTLTVSRPGYAFSPAQMTVSPASDTRVAFAASQQGPARDGEGW